MLTLITWVDPETLYSDSRNSRTQAFQSIIGSITTEVSVVEQTIRTEITSNTKGVWRLNICVDSEQVSLSRFAFKSRDIIPEVRYWKTGVKTRSAGKHLWCDSITTYRYLYLGSNLTISVMSNNPRVTGLTSWGLCVWQTLRQGINCKEKSICRENEMSLMSNKSRRNFLEKNEIRCKDKDYNSRQSKAWRCVWRTLRTQTAVMAALRTSTWSQRKILENRTSQPIHWIP